MKPLYLKVVSVVSLLMIICVMSYAQEHRGCTTDHYLEQRLTKDKNFAEKFKNWNDKSQYTIPKLRLSALTCDTTNSVVVPVAIHYNGPIDCSNQSCLIGAAESQLAQMNEHFAASNTDLDYYLNTLNGICPSSFPLSIVPQVDEGTCIQFAIATKNHPISSGLQDGEPAITVGQHAWPNAGVAWSGYLNIFVSDQATAGQSGGTLGISALPGEANGDGFWITYTSFGGPGFSCTSGVTINSSSTFNLGKTATHEAGHYFGLYHVFKGDCNNSDSDPPGPIDVNDTPAQDGPNYNCPSFTSCSDVPVSCSGNVVNFYSFMDYTDDDCMVLFTVDQTKVINYWANYLDFKDYDLVIDSNTTFTAVNCAGPTCSDGIQNGQEVGIDCGGPSCDVCTFACGDNFVDTGGSIDNYNSNENQTWTICASTDKVVEAVFTVFSVESGGSTGCYDKLNVYDGADINSPELGTYCGNSIADAPGGGIITSSGSCMTFNFISDNSVIREGWEATINCVAVASCSDGIQNGNETGVDCGGSFCDPCNTTCGDTFMDSGADNGSYSNNETTTTLVCPDGPDDVMKVTFTYVDIESASGNGNNGTGCWDVLHIYNGMNESAPLVGTYCGEESGDGNTPSVSTNNLAIGSEFYAANTSGCLFFKFVSDGSVSETGWEADVTCCTSTILNNNACDGGGCDNVMTPGQDFTESITNSCVVPTELTGLSNLKNLSTNRSACSPDPTYGNAVYYELEAGLDPGNLNVDVAANTNGGMIDVALYGPVSGTYPNYTGLDIITCVTGTNPAPISRTFNAGDKYILLVASENMGSFDVDVDFANSALPVEFLSFSAKESDGSILLKWETAQEINNRGFNLQRSENGIEFQNIAWIDGNNNSENISQYTYIDEEVHSGILYFYRLAQEDYNGIKDYSEIINYTILSDKTENKQNVIISPNPSHDIFNISFEHIVPMEIKVHDKTGKLVLRENNLIDNNIRMDLSSKNSGLYHISIFTKEQVFTKNVILIR